MFTKSHGVYQIHQILRYQQIRCGTVRERERKREHPTGIIKII